MFGRTVGEEDSVFFRAIKKAMLPRSSVLEGGMLGPDVLFTPLALISAMGLYNAQ